MQTLTPSPELFFSIISQIRRQQKLNNLKKRLYFSILALIGSLAGFIMFLPVFSEQVSQSGFLQLSSLLSTDFNAIRAFLLDYLLSLAESLPVVSLAFISGILLFCLIFALRIFYDFSEFKQLKLKAR